MNNKSMQEISDKVGENQTAKIGVTCLDCGKNFYIFFERTGEKDAKIEGGVIYETENDRGLKTEFKCPECYKRNPNYGPPVDIYSRVVGFMTPVSSWNNGKQSEWKLRKEYAPLDKDES